MSIFSKLRLKTGNRIEIALLFMLVHKYIFLEKSVKIRENEKKKNPTHLFVEMEKG